MKYFLGISEEAYLQPLLYGLDASSSSLELLVDVPAQTARKLRDRIPPYEKAGCAFLSPLDYARYGADYRIVPGVGVSSLARTGTIQLFIKPDVRNITSLAVDIRVTSEIILAKIILVEKFPNMASVKQHIQYVPMLPDLHAMLAKADAALVVNFTPRPMASPQAFALDLVEEWNDLTGLPYIHGFWVGHEEDEVGNLARELIQAKEDGVSHRDEITGRIAQQNSISTEDATAYLSSFSYGFGEDEQKSLSEFMQYAFYHGVLPDVPEINFLDLDSPPNPLLN